MQMHEVKRDQCREFLAPVFAAWDRQGKKLKYLAASVEVDPSVISHWKTGKRGISERALRRLCITVGIDRAILGKRPYDMRELAPRRKRSA